MTELEELRNRVEILEAQVKDLVRKSRPQMQYQPDRPLGPLPRNEEYEKRRITAFLDSIKKSIEYPATGWIPEEHPNS